MEKIRVWRNSQMPILRQSKKISFVGQIRYFARAVWLEAMSDSPNQILFGIHEGDKLIGYCGLVHVGWEHKVAEVSFLLSNREVTVTEYKKIFLSALNALKEAAEFVGIAELITETYDLPEREQHIFCLEEFGFKLKEVVRHSDAGFSYLHHRLGLRQ